MVVVVREERLARYDVKSKTHAGAESQSLRPQIACRPLHIFICQATTSTNEDCCVSVFFQSHSSFKFPRETGSALVLESLVATFACDYLISELPLQTGTTLI